MGRFFYSLSIQILRAGYLLAALFHSKARKFVAGRRHIFNQVEKVASSFRKAPVVWVHCASLGEFEQGRPIIEALRSRYPQVNIVLTFFSPSGYEVRKNYALADGVLYLPWDTPSQAKKFVTLLKPQLAIFIKYEFWFHYTDQLKRAGANVISASCILRPDQIFFKSYGGFFRKLLHRFDYFFAQNLQTQKLLNSIGIREVDVAGDTRFDRVMTIIREGGEIELAKRFKDGQKLFVIGSCWPEDLDVLAPFMNENGATLKFILAPHEIGDSFLREIEKSLRLRSFRFSSPPPDPENYQVLIVDNIGKLAQLYRYGEFAFVGGAYGQGLHNILEAACYGVPIFFGNKNYEKYQEAVDLINRGGAFEIRDYTDLKSKYELMIDRPENFLLACEVTQSYVKENLGATEKIMKYCTKILSA